MSGGKRDGAGRKPLPETLVKVPYNTKLPAWLKAWLTAKERKESGPVMIEKALRRYYEIDPPTD